jgi:Fur family transcriptional regulator, ferric uptake regulator
MVNQLEQKLLSRSIKPTSMRLLVLHQLMQRSSAVGLTDLMNSFDKADRTTLFRTMRTFEKNKLIHSIIDGTQVPKYALCEDSCACEPNDYHLHFYCLTCKETNCITQSEVPIVSLPDNFVVKEINMTIKGICSNCKG